ncbi:MAG: glycoside hydrolase family 43 protein [candidate division KSB1 bacterium]|nr:glycoside hydrolase family 43 protein [candidate division KSB1 bacterium]MDZ7345641.1 glycoside hydrolase family 43 protein [candidate division KSB1 bacterium]
MHYRAFYPGELWLDDRGFHINAHGGGILYHDGVYYWFGEHKIAGEAGNQAWVGVHCYSSTDLYNWRDEGIVLSVVKDDSTHDLAAGCILERPKVIYNAKTDKFVMWFHLELRDMGYKTARSGVAVAKQPTGPYVFIKSFRPNAGFWPKNVTESERLPNPRAAEYEYSGGSLPLPADELRLYARDFAGGQMARDQTLFVDDDGAAYHIYASEENSTLHISKLTDDYLSYSGEYVRVFVGRFTEAPAIFKYNGKYYFIGSACTGWEPNAARSAVAESIWGPWRELGNPCVGPGAELTFHAQSTFVLPVHGIAGAFIFMADRWNPKNAIDGRYIWLPIRFGKDDRIEIKWANQWSLDVFSEK